MGFAVRTAIVCVAAVLLSTASVAETLEMRVIRVTTGLDPGDGSGRPASDYYVDGGAADGLVPGTRLPVFRELGIRDALRDRDHDVRMPIGELELLRVFEDTAVARVSAIDAWAGAPLFEPRAILIGDLVLPAMPAISRHDGKNPPDAGDTATAAEELRDLMVPSAAAVVVDAASNTVAPTFDADGLSLRTYLPEFPSADVWYPLPPPVLFDLNSSDLNLESQYGLEGVALVLSENPERSISLEGRTCSLGSARYNHALSLRRARTVAAFLQSRGVAAERVSVSGLGEGSPVTFNLTEAERRKNRRVDLKVGNIGPTLAPEIRGITP